MIFFRIKTPEGRIRSAESMPSVGARDETLCALRSYNGMRYRTGFDWHGVQPHFWPRIARELPPRKKTPFLKSRRKGGRPRADDRRSFSAILWRLRTGGAWSRLPQEFGPAITAKRRLARWLKGTILERAWRAYLYQQSRAELERWSECFARSAAREIPFWRFGLDYIWRYEFQPLLAPGEGG